MDGSLLTCCLSSMDPSTLLSMDSSAPSSHHDQDQDLDLHMNGAAKATLSCPPDINLPLSAERSPPPPPWNPPDSDTVLLDVVGLCATQGFEAENFVQLPKVGAGRKCAKRLDSIWGAWFFFRFYFKPALLEKSKAAAMVVVMDDGTNSVSSGFDKSDIKLDVFMVQHDMENMYMWVFKEKPENALGKMQLRSYMNGHSRQGENPFPFSADRGFVRSHRMQRKHYRGLSNPQCVHGIELVPSPNLMSLDKDEQKKWIELTGRDLNFTIPPEASDFGSWRNLPNTEFELERPLPLIKSTPNPHPHPKKLLNGSVLNLSTHLSNNLDNGDGTVLSSSISCKKRKDFFLYGKDEECCLAINPPTDQIPDLVMHPSESHWLNDFSGVMKNVCGPVTAAKTVYEDEHGFLIMISLPFVDLPSVKVSWRNTITHGIIKVSCVSISCKPFIKRNDRTFKLTEPLSEHCPPGEFVREISLPTRIPEDANIEAYYDGPGSVLEIMVPKLLPGAEEHEVRVCLRPNVGNDLMLT